MKKMCYGHSNDVISLGAANIEARGDTVDEKDDEVSPAGSTKGGFIPRFGETADMTVRKCSRPMLSRLI